MGGNPERLPRVMMLGTFGMRPKGTMSARAAGIASALQERSWKPQIVTVPWDNPADAGVIQKADDVPVINTRTTRPAFWPLAVSEIVYEARKFDPDIIHLFKPKGFGDLAARFLRRLGKPVVVDMDDWEGNGGWNDALGYSGTQRRVFDWQERSWPAQADGVTVASRALEQLAHELGSAPQDTHYIPNQLTRRRYEQLTHPGSTNRLPQNLVISGDSQNVLLYTRFVEFHPEFVVDVIVRVARHVPNVRLVVAGSSDDGGSEAQLITAARAAGISDRIQLLGWIDPLVLGDMTRRCSAAIVPFDDNLINRSKCSVKLLELLACRVPVVASNVGENREYIRRHGGGLLAHPNDVIDHADRLIETLTGPPASVSTKPNSFDRIGLWEHVVGDIERCYVRAIRRSQRLHRG